MVGYKVIAKDGSLVTGCNDVEVAISLMRRIPRAARVTTDEGVELAIKVPPLVIRVGGDSVGGSSRAIPTGYVNCMPRAVA